MTYPILKQRLHGPADEAVEADALRREVRSLKDQLDEAQETILQLRAQLVPEHRFPAFCDRLTAAEAELLQMLMLDRPVTADLYDAAHREMRGVMMADPRKQLHVVIYNMRRKLRPHGVEIKTIWGRGYVLPPASRALLTPSPGPEAVVVAGPASLGLHPN